MIISSSGSDFKPIDAGTYTAVCVRVIDLGTQTSAFNGKQQRKLLLSWEVPDVIVETKDNGPMPAMISSSYTASLNEKATLRGVLKSWRGRDFTADELKGFDLKNVLGAACLISVVHSEDGQYANVEAVMALPKGAPKPKATHDLINFDLDAFDPATLDKLSPKLREKIMDSPEYKAATAGPEDSFRGGTADGFSGGADDYPDDRDPIPFITCQGMR